MSKTPTTVILDTNILLDDVLPDRPSKAVSRRAIDLAQKNDVTMLYTVLQARDVFNLVGRHLKESAREQGEDLDKQAGAINKMCWAVTESLDSYATVVGADTTDLWLARKHKQVHPDLEDDLVIAAALRAKADYIVTNDKQLLAHSPVAAMTPASFAALLETVE